jgi:hypothetical protein
MAWIVYPSDHTVTHELTASADIYVEGVTMLRLFVSRQHGTYSVSVNTKSEEIGGTGNNYQTIEQAMRDAERAASGLLREAIQKVSELSGE